MKNKLNQKIIHAVEQIIAQGTDPEQSVGNVVAKESMMLLIFLAQAIWIKFLYSSVITFDSFVFAELVCLFVLLFVAFYPNGHASRIEVACLLLHGLLPGRKERSTEINAFKENYIREHRENKRLTTEVAWLMEIRNLKAVDLGAWVKENISKAPSVERLIRERVWGSMIERKGILVWAVILNKFNLDVENLRLALMANPISTHEGWEGEEALNYLDWGNLSSLDFISSCFKGYTPEDLVRIFTSSPTEKEVLDVLELCQRNNYTLPVMRTFKDLLNWVNVSSDASFLFKELPPAWKVILGPSVLGTISFIENAAQLKTWSQQMSNCIFSRKDKAATGQCFLLGIKQADSFFAVLELDQKGYLVEAKRKANQSLSFSDSDTLQAVLKQIPNRT